MATAEHDDRGGVQHLPADLTGIITVQGHRPPLCWQAVLSITAALQHPSHFVPLSVANQSATNCLSVAYQLPTSCLPVAYQLPISCLPVSYQLPTSQLPVAYQLPNSCLSAAYQLPTYCLSVAHQTPTNCLPVSYQLPTNCLTVAYHLPISCLPIAYQLPTTCLSVAYQLPANYSTALLTQTCSQSLVQLLDLRGWLRDGAMQAPGLHAACWRFWSICGRLASRRA